MVLLLLSFILQTTHANSFYSKWINRNCRFAQSVPATGGDIINKRTSEAVLQGLLSFKPIVQKMLDEETKSIISEKLSEMIGILEQRRNTDNHHFNPIQKTQEELNNKNYNSFLDNSQKSNPNDLDAF